MDKAIDYTRRLIRPIVTLAVVFTAMGMVWMGQPIPTELHQANLICLAFWFGERAISNVMKTKGLMQNGTQ